MQTLKVTISGPAGSGKSGLAAALQYELQARGFLVTVADEKPNPRLRSFDDFGRTPLREHVRVEIRTVAAARAPAEGHVVRDSVAAGTLYEREAAARRQPAPGADLVVALNPKEEPEAFAVAAQKDRDPPADPRPWTPLTVAEAFEAGNLRVEVDAPTPAGRHSAAFAGQDLVKPTTLLRVVHVISKSAGGEVRGYVLVEGETTLRLRLPSYSGDWPEMDAEVQRRVLEQLVGGGR